jgi:hypothetical protein
MKKLACVLVFASAFVAREAFAWGSDGHRAVGAIADKLIKGSDAERQVKAILLPGETLESIANWPDCVKGNYCGPQTPEIRERQPQAQRVPLHRRAVRARPLP